jgi:outer membrane protein OmpA-like peptidoglycan-associated protein
MKNKRSLFIYIVLFSLTMPREMLADNFLGNLKAEIDTLLITVQNKQADKKFENLAYVRAIGKYEKLMDKGFSPDSVRRNLAIAYFKLNQTKKSEELFNTLIINDEADAKDLYYYAQSLKYNQKYNEADEWIAKYKVLKESDSRGKLQYKAAPAIKDIIQKEKYGIEPVYFNSELSDFGAVVFEEQIVFTSSRKEQAVIKYEYSWNEEPYLDIFSTPINKPEIFKGPQLLTKGINSRYHDGPVCYSNDGQEVFVTRNNFELGLPKYSQDKENHFMLYTGRRNAKGWGELKELPFNSPEYSCGHPSLTTNGQKLYFASDMPGGFGGSDIYVVEKTDSGWTTPVNMGGDINTEGDEMFPFISQSGVLYFASNGHMGLGGLDIYMASQAPDGSFGIQNMGCPMNSSSDDFSLYLLPNETQGYFASNRPGGKGEDDIYQFTMLEKPSESIYLTGIIKNKETGEIIPKANVTILDHDGNVLLSQFSDAKGQITTQVTPGLYYTISAVKKDYDSVTLKWLADKSQAKNDALTLEVLLPEIQEWGVFGFIYDKETGNGVEDVEISIQGKDENSQPVYISTDENGKFRQVLEPDKDYGIMLKKENYFTRRGELSTVGKAPGWIDVKEFMEVEMEEIKVGKTIEIPNIYYDLAKWDIRSDAAKELDKVVQFMSDNGSIKIELGSHTDSRGSNLSNQSLSQKRAESAVQYIVNHGVDRSRISAKGYGESKLKNHCANGVLCTEEEHQENRRTEIKIVDF